MLAPKRVFVFCTEHRDADVAGIVKAKALPHVHVELVICFDAKSTKILTNALSPLLLLFIVRVGG